MRTVGLGMMRIGLMAVVVLGGLGGCTFYTSSGGGTPYYAGGYGRGMGKPARVASVDQGSSGGKPAQPSPASRPDNAQPDPAPQPESKPARRAKPPARRASPDEEPKRADPTRKPVEPASSRGRAIAAIPKRVEPTRKPTRAPSRRVAVEPERVEPGATRAPTRAEPRRPAKHQTTSTRRAQGFKVAPSQSRR